MKQFYLTLIALLCCIHISTGQSNDLEIIKSYLASTSRNSEDIKDITIKNSSFSESMQVTNAYVTQQYNGIPIRNVVGNFAIRNDKVLYFKGNFVEDIAAKATATDPALSPEEALRKASAALELGNVSYEKVLQKKSNESYTITKSNISDDDIPITLVYEVVENQLVLSWDMSILTKDHQNWYSVRINAVTGKLVSKDNLMLHCSFDTPVFSKKATPTPSTSFGLKSAKPATLMNGSYTAFPIPVESPNHGGRSSISGQEDAIASPFGWHDTDGQEGAEYTITRGNNVWAAEDRNATNTPGYSPDGGQNLIFDFPFDRDAPFLDYQDASITNLFYMNNITHDIWYKYGFDEASGNFQQNNYGRGGQETDAVNAFAQDGSDTNNATFGTPGDGRAPVMSMFLWNPQTDPNAEGSFVINNSSLAGIYNVVDNAFTEGHIDAPRKPDGITADLVLAIDDDTTDDPDDPNDACSALVNASELVGKIAVVRRGTCTFTSKVQLCQDAGALAVIVVNDDRNPDPEEVIPMGGGLATIDIPAVMINRLNGDPIIAEISNANTTVNATLSDPSDNFVFATDGSFDNGIIAHEYGHGISNRLVGGPSAAGCLQTSQAPEQMGEGWSDWFALMMTVEPGDTGTEARGIGTFAIDQPITGPGIRPNPYSTDMIINPVTYADTNDSANYRAPHGIGSIWASILWDMTWAFVDRDGYDADLYNGAGGNNLAMQLVIDGLKLTSCSPGFVDGRDGILAAADLLPNSDANKCIIWEVFARRGVGFSADQGTTGSRTDQTEAFDLPPNLTGCQTLGVDDISAGVFRIEPNPARNGTFSIRLSENIGDSTIAIFDMNGRVVFEKKARLESVYSINTRLTAGVYVVKIVGEDNTTTGTFKVVME